MTDFPILRDLGLLLVTAAAVVLVARRLRVPPIIAYMVAGLLLGPATGLVHPSESMELISEVGIALLLFLVGLELSLARIRDVGRVAVLGGVAQMALTAGLGYGLATLLGFGAAESALLALGVTFSSTVVVVKLLEHRGDLKALYGRIAVGILLVQDVAVAIALTLVVGLGDPSAMGVESIGRSLLAAFGGMAVLIAAAVIGTRWILPRLFGWLSESLEALFVWSLTWCFAFILGAEALGLSVEIGAFVAGVSLAQLPYSEELVRRVHPLVNFFLAVFFVVLGAEMEPGAALQMWPAALALSLFVLVGKPAVLMALIPRFGFGERTGFLAALTLGQISEFSFILASLAMGAGLVEERFLSLMGLLGLVTIGVSSALIGGADRVYAAASGAGVLRLFRAPPGPEPPERTGLRGHVIVVGMNTLGRRVVQGFLERGETVLAVDVNAANLRGLPCPTLQGNTEHPAVLHEAGLEHAKLLVSALQIEDANNLLAYRAHEAGVPSSIHAFDPDLVEELRETGATHLMVSKYDGIHEVAAALQRAGVMGS